MMKKLILLCFLLGSTLCSFGQLGLTGGLNIAKYNYSGAKNGVAHKPLLAYNFGVNYRTDLTGQLFLLPELSFSLKGAQAYYEYPLGYTGPMKNVNKFGYLGIQLPAIFSFPLGGQIDYEIGGGLYAAYLLKATQRTVEFDGSSATRDFPSGDISKLDAGLHFTTGLKISKRLGLHLSYSPGLMNIEKQKAQLAVRTSNVSVNMSWSFSNDN